MRHGPCTLSSPSPTRQSAGIVYLPFLGILIDNWRDPAEGGEFGTVTGLSLRRMDNTFAIFLLGASVDPVMSQGVSKKTPVN